MPIPQDGAKPWETYYDEPWTPPNWDWDWEPYSELSYRDLLNLDPKYKTGIKNFITQNIHVMGRYGIWGDNWQYLPQYYKDDGIVTCYGPSYKNAWTIFKYYIESCGIYGSQWWYEHNMNNPHDRNKIYGIPYRFWYFPIGGGPQEYSPIIQILPAGTWTAGIFGNCPPYMDRGDMNQLDGWTIQIDKHGVYDYATANVSQNVRTIKSRKV